MRAIILAAGRGERLGEITERIPKLMLQVKGEIILEHNINWLKKYGFKDIYINLHYLPGTIKNYFKSGKAIGVKLNYSHEPELLGSAGAVRKIANDFWKKEIKTFLVIYGDNFFNNKDNIKNIIKFHFKNKGIATIGLYRKISETKKSGVVKIDKNNLVKEFIEKPILEKEIKSNLINTGFYVLEPEILRYIPQGYSDFGKDIFPKLLKSKVSVFGYIFLKGLIAIDTPELYKGVI